MTEPASTANPSLPAAPARASGEATPEAFDALLEPPPPAPAPDSTGSNETPASAADAPPSIPEKRLTAAAAASESAAPSLRELTGHAELYRDPIACAVLAGAGLGALGVFAVLRRAAFMTATLSTAAGSGVVLALSLELQLGLAVPPAAGALAATLTCVALLAGHRSRRLPRDARIALVSLAATAFALLLESRIVEEAHGVSGILFGSAVLVSPQELWAVLGGTLAAFALVACTWRALTFAGFDPDAALVQGVRVRRLEAAFWLVFALEVAVATRALGALPVFAFSVLPAAAGLSLARSVPDALLLSTLAGAASGGLGYVLAFLAELPVGGSQTAVATALAVLAMTARRLRN